MDIKERFVINEDYGLLLHYFGEESYLDLLEKFSKEKDIEKCDKMIMVLERPICKDYEDIRMMRNRRIQGKKHDAKERANNYWKKYSNNLTPMYLTHILKGELPNIDRKDIKSNKELLEVKKSQILIHRLGRIIKNCKNKENGKK